MLYHNRYLTVNLNELRIYVGFLNSLLKNTTKIVEDDVEYFDYLQPLQKDLLFCQKASSEKSFKTILNL